MASLSSSVPATAGPTPPLSPSSSYTDDRLVSSSSPALTSLPVEVLELILARVAAPPGAPFVAGHVATAALTPAALTCTTLREAAAPLTAVALACATCTAVVGHPRDAVRAPAGRTYRSPGAVVVGAPPAGGTEFLRLVVHGVIAHAPAAATSTPGWEVRGDALSTFGVWRELVVRRALSPNVEAAGRSHCSVRLVWCRGCGVWIGFVGPAGEDVYLAKAYVCLVDGRGRRLPPPPPPSSFAAAAREGEAAGSTGAGTAPTASAASDAAHAAAPVGGDGTSSPSPGVAASSSVSASPPPPVPLLGVGAPCPPASLASPPSTPPATVAAGSPPGTPASSVPPPPRQLGCAGCGAGLTSTAELLPWQHVLAGHSLRDVDPYLDWSSGYTPAASVGGGGGGGGGGPGAAAPPPGGAAPPAGSGAPPGAPPPPAPPPPTLAAGV